MKLRSLPLNIGGLPTVLLTTIGEREDLSRKQLAEMVGDQNSADTFRHAIAKLKALGFIRESVTLTNDGLDLLYELEVRAKGGAGFSGRQRWAGLGQPTAQPEYPLACTDEQVGQIEKEARESAALALSAAPDLVAGMTNNWPAGTSQKLVG